MRSLGMGSDKRFGNGEFNLFVLYCADLRSEIYKLLPFSMNLTRKLHLTLLWSKEYFNV